MRKELIQYLGKDKLEIAKGEIKECNFYIIRTNKELESEEINNEKNTIIFANDFFIVQDSKRYSGDIIINKNQDTIVVTFNEKLMVNYNLIKSKRVELQEEILEDFLYSLSLYYLKNEDFKNTEIILAKTKDVKTYIGFKNAEENGKLEIITGEIEALINDRCKRFINGKLPIKIKSEKDDKIILIELLNKIINDKDSKLLWDYKHHYDRISVKKEDVDKNLKFNRLDNIYGEVSNVVIGNTKINIGLKVKIKGQVENIKNNLKLDACIYREYNIILNGEVNNKTVWCILSNKLKNELAKEKIIKIVTNSRYDGKQVYAIDISKIPITNEGQLHLLTNEELANYIFEVEDLKYKISYLNKKIQSLLNGKNLNKLDFKGKLSNEQIIVRKDFRININGIYTPEIVKESENHRMYIADIVQWSIEKFPKKKTEELTEKCVNDLISEDINESYQKLTMLLNEYKNEKREKEFIINTIRISSYILNKDVFYFNKEEYKNKESYDKGLNINIIIGSKVKVSRNIVNGINIKQEKFKIITKSS